MIIYLYNAQTKKYSFALIKENKRIFGMDNTKGWHVHPFENPDSYLPADDINLSIFLSFINNEKDKWL